MGCRECHYWKGKQPDIYGFCKPPSGEVLPFWAKLYEADMQARTQRGEGRDCDLFSPRPQ